MVGAKPHRRWHRVGAEATLNLVRLRERQARSAGEGGAAAHAPSPAALSAATSSAIGQDVVRRPVNDGLYAGVNMGTGGPPSLGTNFSFTSCPIFSVAKSQSTRLVIIDGPSSSVT